MVNFTKKIVCCSKAVERLVIQQEGIPAVKTAVVYNGINEDKFVSIGKADEKKKELNIADSIVIGVVASLNRNKGHKILFDAAKQPIDNKEVDWGGCKSFKDTLSKSEREQYEAEEKAADKKIMN